MRLLRGTTADFLVLPVPDQIGGGGRVLPLAAPHVAIDVEDLEQIAALGWRGLEEAQLGTWLLRAAAGFTGRANSALVLGAPPVTEGGWLADLVSWYAEKGLPPMAQIPLPSGAPVEAMLDAAGWRAHDHVRVLTGDIHEVQGLAAAHPTQQDDLVVRHDSEPDRAWLTSYKYRGAALPAHAREVMRRAGPRTQLSFASLRTGENNDPGGVLAVARGAVAQGWLGITAVTVPDQHRRRGFGTKLMAHLAGWGAERGGQAIYLQVASDNSAALELYERLGFHHHHDYRYRIGPAPRSD